MSQANNFGSALNSMESAGRSVLDRLGVPKTRWSARIRWRLCVLCGCCRWVSGQEPGGDGRGQWPTGDRLAAAMRAAGARAVGLDESGPVSPARL